MFMDIFDQILENLELERELGTRTVEIDRALLVPPTVEKAPKSEPEPARKPAAPNPPASTLWLLPFCFCSFSKRQNTKNEGSEGT